MNHIIPKIINTSRSALGWELVLDGWYPGNMSHYTACCSCMYFLWTGESFYFIVSIFNWEKTHHLCHMTSPENKGQVLQCRMLLTTLGSGEALSLLVTFLGLDPEPRGSGGILCWSQRCPLVLCVSTRNCFVS